MRKKYRLPAAAFVLCGAFMMALNVQKMPLYAETVQDTVITNDENGIPDSNFYNALLEQYDSNGDGVLTKKEVSDGPYLLKLEDKNITDIRGIEKISGFRALVLNNNNISDISPLSGLKDLRLIMLNGNNISSIDAIKNFKHLDQLWMNDNHVSDLTPLKDLDELSYLSMKNNDISDISVLQGKSSLTHLELNGNDIQDIYPLADMKQLIMLKLADNDISDISALSGFVNLKELELGSNNITDINPLKDSYGITSLKLNDNQISDISALSQYGSLNKLELQNNNISDIEPLRLFFDGCSTRYDDFAYFDDNLDNLQGKVLLYGNRITESAYKSVVASSILNYEPMLRVHLDDGSLQVVLSGVTWMQAQKAIAEDSGSDSGNNTVSPRGSLVQYADGSWYYVVDNAVDYSYNGLAANEYGWWYVSNGTIDFGYTGMAANEYGWWYVSNGTIDFGYTGMAVNEYGWWYMTNGALDFNYTGMALNEYGWWYMTNGALDLNYTGMAINEYGTWYMVNGFLASDFTGTVHSIKVVNGLVVEHAHNWQHHDAVYGEKFIPEENMKKTEDGYYFIDDGWERVEEAHIICGTCKKDFGPGDDAVEKWAEHALSGDFYTGCQNYFVDWILVGEKCYTLLTPAYDECTECGVTRR